MLTQVTFAMVTEHGFNENENHFYIHRVARTLCITVGGITSAAESSQPPAVCPHLRTLLSSLQFSFGKLSSTAVVPNPNIGKHWRWLQWG